MSQRLTILTEIDTHALAQADALYELGTLWNSPLTTISHCHYHLSLSIIWRRRETNRE